jgi:DNA-binding MarR family transcriptional regulator
MEAAGLVKRDAASSHVTLHLTSRGRELEMIIERDMRTLGERALGSLTNVQRAQFVQLLREVRANLADR